LASLEDFAMSGSRVLIVEDEALVGMMLEDALDSLGIEVASIAGTLEEAIAQASDGNFDCAILDVQLRGKDILPVAELLERRGIRFIFATGYGQTGLPQKYRTVPVLQKPFMAEDLKRVLGSVGISTLSRP
jgi:CheY-like chemotaxis protein